jgi:hypothetical protein
MTVRGDGRVDDVCGDGRVDDEEEDEEMEMTGSSFSILTHIGELTTGGR